MPDTESRRFGGGRRGRGGGGTSRLLYDSRFSACCDISYNSGMVLSLRRSLHPFQSQEIVKADAFSRDFSHLRELACVRMEYQL